MVPVSGPGGLVAPSFESTVMQVGGWSTGMTLLSALLSVAAHRECHPYLKLLGFSKERRPVTPKVAGSSPVAPAIFRNGPCARAPPSSPAAQAAGSARNAAR